MNKTEKIYYLERALATLILSNQTAYPPSAVKWAASKEVYGYATETFMDLMSKVIQEDMPELSSEYKISFSVYAGCNEKNSKTKVALFISETLNLTIGEAITLLEKTSSDYSAGVFRHQVKSTEEALEFALKLEKADLDYSSIIWSPCSREPSFFASTKELELIIDKYNYASSTGTCCGKETTLTPGLVATDP